MHTHFNVRLTVVSVMGSAQIAQRLVAGRHKRTLTCARGTAVVMRRTAETEGTGVHSGGRAGLV